MDGLNGLIMVKFNKLYQSIYLQKVAQRQRQRQLTNEVINSMEVKNIYTHCKRDFGYREKIIYRDGNIDKMNIKKNTQTSIR